MADDEIYEDLIELSKRRGFLFPSTEIYGGVAGFWDYGPHGTRVKEQVLDAWRDRYVRREGFDEIDTPTIGKRDIFEASGHADGFSDALVQCGDCDAVFRADHVVEDHTDVENADGLPTDELEGLIADHDLACPGCGASLAGREVRTFNLMFETQIGPTGGRPAFLRPETAQGIFVDFPRLKRYAREQLPFGVTQIGTAYRNEINPRKGVVRLREFQQAELEYFKHPDDEIDGVHDVEDVTVRLYPIEAQRRDDGEAFETTVGDAVEDGVIASETIAYFVGVSQRWYEAIGVDPERLRFRQHLGDERAHYASDCWDGETYTERFGWIEVNGVADRSTYDLDKHAEHSGEEMAVFQEYDEPVTRERATVDPDMGALGPRFGDDAPAVAAALQALAEDDPGAFEGDTVTVEVDGERHEVPVEDTGFSVDEVTESGEHVTPQVIEPSYGLDRIVFTVLAHSYDRDRPASSDEERTVLRLPPAVAPTDVAVFPLVTKDGLGETADEVAASLRATGLHVDHDDSGAIGRRYRRHDEIGTPFCVTVDYDTLEDGTVTVRERDTTEQRRVPLDDLAETVRGLIAGEVDFDAV